MNIYSLLCHLNSWRYNIVYLIFLQLIVREVHIQNLGYVWHALSVPIKMNLVSPHVSLVPAVLPRNMKVVRILRIAQVQQFCDSKNVTSQRMIIVLCFFTNFGYREHFLSTNLWYILTNNYMVSQWIFFRISIKEREKI